jgi:hypothetical protein
MARGSAQTLQAQRGDLAIILQVQVRMQQQRGLMVVKQQQQQQAGRVRRVLAVTVMRSWQRRGWQRLCSSH